MKTMHPAACRPQHRPLVTALLAATLAGPAAAQAPPPVEHLPPADHAVWAFGGVLKSSPAYAGGSAQQLRLSPLWAVRWGRFRISGSGASGLLATPGDSGSGASAELLSGDKWKAGAALRFDNGRRSSDDPALNGQPDVKRTLRGRFYASRDLGDGWRGSLAYSVDLLGRSGGATASADLGYGWEPWPGISASVGGGLALANGRYMASYFGVTPASAQATGHPAYNPGAGLLDVHAGMGLRKPLGEHWVLFGGVGLAQLQGDAAASPLTGRRSSLSGSIGLAWRTR